MHSLVVIGKCFCWSWKIECTQIRGKAPTISRDIHRINYRMDSVLQCPKVSGGFRLQDTSNQKKIADVHDVRFQLFRAKCGNIESGQLPPCRDTLELHIQRANYNTAVWRRSLLNNPDNTTVELLYNENVFAAKKISQ